MILHTSVLPKEAIDLLDVHSNGSYIDCTLGGGGHTRSLLEQSAPNGRVLAFELDEETIEKTGKALKSFGKRLTIVRANFRAIGSIARQNGFDQVDGIIYDLGLSIDLLKDRGRGFSFLADEPLDMRFDADAQFIAKDLVNSWTEKEIADTIFQFGEERYSRRIAKSIVEARKKKRITTTGELTALIEKSVPGPYRRGRIHCATRTFQAIRIAVNDELGALEKSLEVAFDLLAPNGRIAVISFHSLEDRIVKHAFRAHAIAKRARLLTKKPIIPTPEEQASNPASRSAKLRGISKLYV